jgi:anion transporter
VTGAALGWEAWATVAVVLLMLGALVRDLVPPAAAVLGAAVALLLLGVVGPEQAFSGFANPAPWTVAALYVVARAVRVTGALDSAVGLLLGRDRDRCDPREGERMRLLRLLVPTGSASALLNNTPVVATLASQTTEWAERRGLPSSALLMPISFAAVLGGLLTAVGTSTTLVVSGLLEHHDQPPIGVFEITAVGAPLFVVGVAVLVLFAPVVLPLRAKDAAVAAVPERTLPVGGRSEPVTVDHASARPPARSHRTFVTLAVGAAMLILAATPLLSILEAALIAACALVASGVLSIREAREAIDLDVLTIIAAAFGIGEAMTASGLATRLAGLLLDAAGPFGGLALLVGVMLATVVLTELITNNAAAVLMFPVAVAVADATGIDLRPLAIGVAVAASASFLTPIGYQTNTIVYRLGRYRFGDFARLGLPLTATAIGVSALVIPAVWPL